MFGKEMKKGIGDTDRRGEMIGVEVETEGRERVGPDDNEETEVG